MNAAQDKTSSDFLQPNADSALSALADGELTDFECDVLLRNVVDTEPLHQQWLSYQIIGQVLSGSLVEGSARSSQDFLKGVVARLPSEVLRELPLAPDVRLLQVRADAANDPVVRWKWVAGVASLAAMMAVSWTVLRDAPSGPASLSGPVLASSEAAPVAGAGTKASAVVVNTAQGALIRDARLEQLLAEHRQYGTMSALHMPAGFLRSATHEAAERR